MEFTMADMWAKSGVIAKSVVVILLIMALVVLTVAIERFIVYLLAKKQSKAYVVLIDNLLKTGRFKEASDAALQFKFSHVAKMIRSGLTEYMKGSLINPAPEGGVCYDVIGAVNRALEKAGAREMAGMRRGLAGLATVGSTAPFVGLFGTVFGIINSFQGMAKEGAGGIGAVSAGIAEALITTAVGIGVAIIAVLLYNYFTSKVDMLQVETNESSLEILDLLVKVPPPKK
jgi:biopolymer transport protein ExbB/TolQ